MFGLSPWEIAVILLVAVLLFGKRLPELGSSLGKAITNFRNSCKNNSIENENKNIDFKCEKADIETENLNTSASNTNKSDKE
ncbi:MAG: Sec-independent protein translocase subunit TatA/TatB [Bdellovibrionota bacterium]